jgi:molybdopterin-containing oxidoreductase family iron-sulfur binding subunit
MANQKNYWKSTAELDNNNAFVEDLKGREFVEKLPEDAFLGDDQVMNDSKTNRRDFLKYVGFSTAAASLAACEGPVHKSIPYVVQPEEIRPGISNFYATTIADGFDMASILVKTREGRPIKVENNTDAPASYRANARVQASVLSLYDTFRLQGPTQSGSPVSWATLLGQSRQQLDNLQAEGAQVVLLTQSFASPSTQALIDQLTAKYKNIKHIAYDAVSSSHALDAFEKAYGQRALPTYDFSKAETIVSFDADFIGDWQGGGYAPGYVKTRVPVKKNGKAKMSTHFQFEANMTLSGAAADKRVPMSAAQQQQLLAALYSELTNGQASGEQAIQDMAKVTARHLRKAGKKAVVITGLTSVEAQRVALAINEKLGSVVIDTQHTTTVRQGSANQLTQLVDDLNSGAVQGIITAGVNPVYTLANGEQFATGLNKAKFSLSFSMKNDETASKAQWVAATPHYLESWGDVEFKTNHFGLTQPTIRPLFDTKQFQDVLLTWLDKDTSYRDELRSYWEQNILNGKSWNKTLHDGFYVGNSSSKQNHYRDAVADAVRSLSAATQDGYTLNLYTKTGIGDGQQANNPWLHELPDPITRVTWDNYLTVSKSDADALGLWNETQSDGSLNGGLAKITVGSSSLTVPVLIQPGQAKGTVGLGFGYGKQAGVKSEMQIGANAYTLYNDFSSVQPVSIEAVDGTHEFACTQLQNTLMGREDIVKETTLEIFNTKDRNDYNAVPVVSKNHIETVVTSPEVDIWDQFDRSVGHHFNLSIDLNACTGCGACVVACHAENNVPVVGKREIRKSRDMHWLRIDRYYSSEDTFEGDNNTVNEINGLGESLTTFSSLEEPSANPQVTFQPIMCQHCNHAPCETVCPVAATSHGRQGQNHMAYNRCVGTRYCANNCPYKVRRFNWFLYNHNDEFDFHMNNDLGRMVLNPDVVVRSRGVMEKCSLCIQKTQKTILDAKLERRDIADGEFQTACSSACATGAITFGDINDKTSRVAKSLESDRMYHLLESVGTKPNVQYQVKVRNTETS